jgi:adenylate cyclase
MGLNSGIMTVGNMGSTGRMAYTLSGDNVNLGSRLEGLNKQYGTHIMMSEYTYGLVKDKVIARELDNVRVKGKNKPVVVYELIDVPEGLEPPESRDKKKKGRGTTLPLKRMAAALSCAVLTLCVSCELTHFPIS